MALSIGIPLAERLERHPHGALAALAPDPGITFGLELGDGAVVCHPRIKARLRRIDNPGILRYRDRVFILWNAAHNRMFPWPLSILLISN